MAQGINANKRRGREWWGKRPMNYYPVSHKGNKRAKRQLHKMERKRKRMRHGRQDEA